MLHGKKKQRIDWHDLVLFYEDSEGDLNVISEDQDVKTAECYSKQKNLSYLKCSLVNREKFNLIRDEQENSQLNRSRTYENEDGHRLEDS